MNKLPTQHAMREEKMSGQPSAVACRSAELHGSAARDAAAAARGLPDYLPELLTTIIEQRPELADMIALIP